MLTHSIIQSPNVIFAKDQQDEFTAVRDLLPAVEDTLVAGYELEGRSGFFLMNSNKPDVAARFLQRTQTAGQRIMDLDSRRWTGPHFVALAVDKASKRLKRGSTARLTLQAQAEELYERSVELDSTEGALDLMNYAEAQLMEGNFQKAITYADRYKALDILAPNEHIVACNFIESVSKYAISGSRSDLLAAQAAARKVARTRFQNYDWSDYQDLLTDKDSPMKVGKAPAVKKNLLDLIGAVCDSTGANALSIEAVNKKYPFMATLDQK